MQLPSLITPPPNQIPKSTNKIQAAAALPFPFPLPPSIVAVGGDEEGIVAVGAWVRRVRRVVGVLPPSGRLPLHADVPPAAADQDLGDRRGQRGHGHRADHPDPRPGGRDRAGGRAPGQAPRGDAGPAARGGVPPARAPRLRHRPGRDQGLRPCHRHGRRTPDPGGDQAQPAAAERVPVPQDRAGAGGALPGGAAAHRLQPRRRPHLRRLEALGLPRQPRHRLRHQPRLLPLPLPPRRAPRRQRPGRPGVHGGGARRQLGGDLVEHQRGRHAGAQVAAGEPPVLRRGGAGEHPAGGGGQRVRGDQPQGLHLLGHRLLRCQPRLLPPPRSAPHPPRLRPRQGLPRHLRRPRGLPQPPRPPRPRRGPRRRRDGAHRGGGQEAPPLRQDALGELQPPRPLISDCHDHNHTSLVSCPLISY